MDTNLEDKEDEKKDEGDWENEGGAGVREPKSPINPPDKSGAEAVPEPELIAAWYY